MEYTYIPTGIKRELVRIGVDYNWKGQIVAIVGGIMVVNIPHTHSLTAIEKFLSIHIPTSHLPHCSFYPIPISF